MSSPTKKQYELAKDMPKCPFCGGLPYADVPTVFGEEFSVRCSKCSATASPEHWGKREVSRVFHWLLNEISKTEQAANLRGEIASAELAKVARMIEPLFSGNPKTKVPTKRSTTVAKEYQRARRDSK